MQQILDYFAGLDIYGWLEIIAMFVGIYYVYLEIRKTFGQKMGVDLYNQIKPLLR